MSDASKGQTKGPPILRTALYLLPLQALLRGGEAVLPLLLAAWLGRSTATDLYYLLASYFVFAGALLTAAFQDSAVVPVLIEVEAHDPESFGTIAGSLLGHTLLLSSALATLLGALAAGLALAFSSEVHLALTLIGLMALALVATSVRAFFVGLMNARSFFHAHPIASGLGTGLSIAIIYAGHASLGVIVIPLATIAGELLAIAILFALCTRSLRARIAPNLARPEPVLRIVRLVRLEAAGQIITRINPVLDQLMSGMAMVAGGGTLLRYATDIASLPTSILQATVLPVFLTRIAHEASDPTSFASTLKKTLASAVAILVILALAFAALRTPIARLLFLHGAMDDAGVVRIAAILPWALLGVAPFGALLLLARAHVARQNSRIMPSMGILNAALNAIFNFVFVHFMGLSGIALSTSVTYLVVAIVFWIRLPKDVRT